MAIEYTEKTRTAIRNTWVKNTQKYLSEKDDFQKLLGLQNIRQMWQNVESGSGTNAEALTRLTALGFGEQVDKVKRLIDSSEDVSDKSLIANFGLKIQTGK